MEPRAENFRSAAREALADDRLHNAFGDATTRFRTARRMAFEAFPEGEDLRDQARAIKKKVIEDLDNYLARLRQSVTEAGGTFHLAADAAEARRIITGIATSSVTPEGGARLAVKSKSMTTEEIGLNDALAAAGVEPVETDLGEYIIQLAGETPSHIIAPAIHKTREDVTELFSIKLGSPRLEEHEALTQEARRVLRDKFRQADIGISGVNFAVAETGTIAIVENEGNARLSTSLPRVHVAVMGMEKIVPDMASLSIFLKILARSATGQKASSYVSLITGPRKALEIDGPEELHVVAVDNGRSRLLADPVLREALYCIRCGACLNACPVYRHAGGHSYGWVYSGPIGAVINPSLLGPEKASPLPYASSLCGACREVCPVRINLPKLLLEQRKNVVEKKSNPLERLAIRAVTFMTSTSGRYRWVSRLVRWARLAPALGPLAGWKRYRNLPKPPRRTFLEEQRDEQRKRAS